MPETSDPLAVIHARRYLEEVNQYILHGEGEILESPGKLNLVWTDPASDTQRFLSIKAAEGNQIFINGRLYPATEIELRKGLRARLAKIG